MKKLYTLLSAVVFFNSYDVAAQLFVNVFSPEKKVVFNGEIKVGDPNNWVADMKMLQEYGFKPQFDLHLGIKHYTQWLKASE